MTSHVGRRGAVVRRLAAAAALLLAPLQSAPAQAATPPTTAAQPTAQPTTPPASQPGAALPSDAELREQVSELREAEAWLGLPDPQDAVRGGRVVAADERVVGDVAVTRGTLDVYGTVTGDAVALGGDVVIHPGGRVLGDAVAVLGRVRLEGGILGGELRAVRGDLTPTPIVAAPGPVAAIRGQLGLVGGWLAMLLVMGVGVMIFAGGPLAGVVTTLQNGFGRALATGVAAQLALAPGLLVLVIALAATIIGILLIPFAVVAFALAAMGLMTLGFLAVARITGDALTRRRAAASERGALLRSLLVGIVVFMAGWVVAALLAPAPVAATVARAAAFALCWVAVTAGFGAALLSRAGTRRPVDALADQPSPPMEEELSWQTPTPIGGVLAARRPTSTTSTR